MMREMVKKIKLALRGRGRRRVKDNEKRIIIFKHLTRKGRKPLLNPAIGRKRSVQL